MDTRTDRRASNLPLPLGGFIGRARELGTLRGVLPGARLLTLTGPGGVGKTRLALELARASATTSGTVWSWSTWGLTDAKLVSEMVASALGVAQQARRPVATALLDFLRERELLLVLDNCEHLVQACAELAAALLSAAAGLRILATSREPLAVVGETVWQVPS